jgi:hypothetical protein
MRRDSTHGNFDRGVEEGAAHICSKLAYKDEVA